MLLSLDEKSEERILIDEFFEIKPPKPNGGFKRNDKYHDIYYEMDNNDQWTDSWSVSLSEKEGYIMGGTYMDNGCMNILMHKIGIDLSMVEFNDHCDSVSMATHPESVKFFAKKINIEMEKFEKLSEEKKEEARTFNFAPPSKNPYEAKEEDFKHDWIDPYVDIDGIHFYKRVEK